MTDMIERLIGEMTLEEKIGQLNQVGPSPMGGIEVSPEELKRMLEDGRITPEQYRESVGIAGDIVKTNGHGQIIRNAPL